jgi:hypothetical protein
MVLHEPVKRDVHGEQSLNDQEKQNEKKDDTDKKSENGSDSPREFEKTVITHCQ